MMTTTQKPEEQQTAAIVTTSDIETTRTVTKSQAATSNMKGSPILLTPGELGEIIQRAS